MADGRAERSGVGDELFDRLLQESHRCAPDDLAALVARHAVPAGIEDLVIYLIDVQQERLVPVPESSQRPARYAPVSVDGSMAGQSFRRLELLDAPAERDGSPVRRVWVPLLDGIERLGVLHAVVPSLDAGTGARLRRLASLVALLLVSKRGYSDTFLQLRRNRPMTLSAEIQWALLPPLTFASDRVLISGAMEPAYEIGGDAFDYAMQGRLAHLAIFDSMGHDLAASLTASIAIGACRRSRRQGAGLLEVGDDIDAAVRAQFGGQRFVTALLATLDTDEGRLQWVNCGHPTPLLLRDGHVVKSLGGRPAPPLGLGLGRRTLVQEQLQPGDRLLLYSDGIIEARNATTGEFFGLDRFVDLIDRWDSAGLPAPETLRRLIAAILAHQNGRLTDDATVMFVEWDAGQSERFMV